MPGFDNQIVYASNVDFTGNSLTKGTPQISSNGQLLIGSATGVNGPCLLAGSITSSDGSITVTNGAGTISITVTGGSSVGKTITGNTGGALTPSLGNWNILGTGSLTSGGSGNTLTFSLTGLTNHAVLVGSGGATITKVGPTATAGQVFQSGGSSADPVFSTATYPSTVGAGKLLYAATSNTVTPVSFSIVIQVFSATGSNTYNATSGLQYAIVEIVGAGGGGGGVASQSAGNGGGSGGGGGGAYVRKTFPASTIGSSQTVTIGTGGGGGSNSGGAGSNGGDSTFGALLTGAHGLGGAAQITGVGTGQSAGGAGGTASGGTVNINGQTGGWGGTATAGTVVVGGGGGNSYLGFGAPTIFANTAGAAGTGFGGGGSGAAGQATGGGFTGGAGANGYCVVTEYVLS